MDERQIRIADMTGLKYTSRSLAPEPFARLSRIRLHPFASDDYLTIGLAVENNNGERLLKTLDRRALERIQCLQDAPIDVDWILHRIQRAKSQGWERLEDLGESIASFSVTLSLPEPYHAPIDAPRFDLLFQSLVALAEKPPKARDFVSQGRDEVRSRVFAQIRRKGDLRAEQIINEKPLMIAEKRPPLEIDLLTKNQAGVIVSAWYATESSIETGFLRAFVDIECYLNTKPASGAIFVLRPDDRTGIPEKRLSVIDDMIEKLQWKATSAGLDAATEFSADALADDILAWADV